MQPPISAHRRIATQVVEDTSHLDYTENLRKTSRAHIAALGTSSMPKALCILGMVISLLLLVVFGLDLAVGFPFRTASKSMDIGFVVSAAILGYLSWTSMREQV